MQEDVRYLIDADDKATAKILKVNQSVEQQVKHVREVGGQAKASTEMVGALATSMGASGIGGFAGELAMLTERVSAFSEVSKAGGAGALAFKAGLVGAAAVISVNVGKALGDVIFKTERWNRLLEDSKQRASELDAELSGRLANTLREQIDLGRQIAESTGDFTQLADARNRLRMEELGLEKQISSALKNKREAEEAYFQTALTTSTIEKSDADIKRIREQIKALRELQQATTAVSLAEKQREQVVANQEKAMERSQTLVRGMIRDLAILKAEGEDRQRLELARSGVFGEDQMQQALELQRQMNRLKDEQAAKEKAIKDAQKQRVDNLKMQSDQEKEQIQALQERIRLLGQASGQSSVAGPLSAGASTRLATGAGSGFRKTAAVIEAERQTAIQKRQEQLQERLVELMEKNQQTQQTIIKVIGD